MQNYLFRRLAQMVPTFIGITFLSFLLVKLTPGDPVISMFPPEVLQRVDREVLRERLGLNDPIYVQYARTMTQMARGELTSFLDGRPTITLIAERMPPTLLFTATTITLSLLIGVTIALLAARHPGGWFDHTTSAGVLLGISVPSFWVAPIIMYIFAERLRWLPATGLRPIGATSYNLAEMLPYMIMPTAILTVGFLPAVVRFSRAGLLDVFDQDYIRTARSKGLSEVYVTWKHALRNALLPIVTLLGTAIPGFIGGFVIVETIFAIPGLGRLAVRAALGRDIPLIMTINVFVVLLVLVANLITDLVYALLDPRIRLDD